MFAVAYLGLGSNSPDKISRLDAAAEAIGRLPGVRISALSSLYLTEPQDVVDQPWFANRVAEARASAAWTPQAMISIGRTAITYDLGVDFSSSCPGMFQFL